MEVLHVVASLEGGAARHIVHLARELRALGIRSSVASPLDHVALKTELEGSGFVFYELPPQPIAALRRLIAVARERPYTHVHVHGHRASFLGRLAKPHFGRDVALVYTVHGYHPAHYLHPVQRWLVNGLERLLASRTDVFVCVSASTAEELQQAVPQAKGRCFVVENGIPFHPFSPEEFDTLRQGGRGEMRFSMNHFVIGAVARMHWQKGIDRLLQAFALISPAYPSARLLLAGDGPLKARLESQAHAMGLGMKCLFAGRTNQASRLYPVMDLFVLPSLWEGLPLTILEAWSVGIPVVAANVPGSRELIEDERTGFLADDSVEGIAEAIRRAWEKKELYPRIIQNAQHRLRDRFSVERMGAKTAELYRQVSVGKNLATNS
jgi:glycosyltransferase involved in cell wall biosynthesis